MEAIRLDKIPLSLLASIVYTGRIFNRRTMVELPGTEKEGKNLELRRGNENENEKDKFHTLSCVPWS
jgi:hypothetical protein